LRSYYVTISHSVLLFLSLCFQHGTIKFFQKKQWFQPIYELSPESHQEKTKVPSFGGIGFLVTILAGAFWFNAFTPQILWILFAFICFSSIGFVDDVISFLCKNNKGLSAKQKLGMQILVSSGLTLLWHHQFQSLSIVTFIVYVFAFIATTNATNLTDGVDGLLMSTFLVSLWGIYTTYLSLGISAEMGELFKIILIASCGFLWFNWNPARIFMGDTGSLGIGGLVVALVISLGNIWLLIPFGIVFIIETLSVIIQVSWFKRTGKRLLLMSPLHHHFEMLKWSEKQIVGLFVSIQFIACAIFLFVGTIK